MEKKMYWDEEARSDVICEKMDLEEPICRTCRHYLDFRIPEQIKRYAPGEGRCMLNDKTPPGMMGFAKAGLVAGAYPEEFSAEFMTEDSKEGPAVYLVVRDDSFCSEWEDCNPNRMLENSEILPKKEK